MRAPSIPAVAAGFFAGETRAYSMMTRVTVRCFCSARRRRIEAAGLPSLSLRRSGLCSTLRRMYCTVHHSLTRPLQRCSDLARHCSLASTRTCATTWVSVACTRDIHAAVSHHRSARLFPTDPETASVCACTVAKLLKAYKTAPGGFTAADLW